MPNRNYATITAYLASMVLKNGYLLKTPITVSTYFSPLSPVGIASWISTWILVNGLYVPTDFTVGDSKGLPDTCCAMAATIPPCLAILLQHVLGIPIHEGAELCLHLCR